MTSLLADHLITDAYTQLVAAGNSLDPAALKLRLLQGAIPTGQRTALADLTAADFAGYADAALTVAAIGPQLGADGNYYLTWDDQVFTAGALTGAQTVTGYCLFAGTDLLKWCQLTTPITVDTVGQIVIVRPELELYPVDSRIGSAVSP